MVVGWDKLETFHISPDERDEVYQVVRNIWSECKRALALRIATPVVHLYTMDEAQPGAASECGLIQKVVEVEHRVTSLG